MIYIGLGSNLGNRKNNIEKTKYKLIENGIKIIESSSCYESLSWPNIKYPKFLNVVLKISTKMSPFELLHNCKNIEKSLGRKKGPKNSPRICDIDILDFNKKKIKTYVTLPHPRLHKRNFVLFPLFELDKEWIHPVSNYNIKRLLTLLPNNDITSIKKI